MPPTLIPFLAEHIGMLKTRDAAQTEPWALAVEKERKGPAYTVLVDGKVIACAGVMVVWPGVGMAWANVGEGFESDGRWRWCTRTMRRFLSDVMRSHRLHRLEGTVLADSERNQRYLEFLGFTRENGKAHAFTPDRRDAVRYERIR